MHVFVKPLCIRNKNGYIAKLFESIQLHLFSENIHHDSLTSVYPCPLLKGQITPPRLDKADCVLGAEA